MTRFHPLLMLCVALLTCCLAGGATAQVRNAPAGNNLPEETHTGQEVGESHGPDDGHDHVTQLSDEAHDAFARQVDLDAFRALPVFDAGRAKIVDTLAREQIN